MQAPDWAVRMIRWRWTPSVALVSGSLVFVAFAVAIVPDDLGAVASGAESSSRRARSRLVTNDAATNAEPPVTPGEQDPPAPPVPPPATATAYTLSTSPSPPADDPAAQTGSDTPPVTPGP